MHSEEGLLLSEGFEDAGVLLGERQGRRPARRPGSRFILLALCLHALPVLACLGRLELLGRPSEGGSGWNRGCRVVWEGSGVTDQPPRSFSARHPGARPRASGRHSAFPFLGAADACGIRAEADRLRADDPTPGPDAPPAAPDPAPVTAPGGGAGGSGGPVRGEGESLGSAGELDAPVWNPRPAYPAAARKAGWEGRVEVELEVGPDGRVTRARVLSSSGHEVLDRAALAALGRWRFAPRRSASARILHQEVVFRLENVNAVSLSQK